MFDDLVCPAHQVWRLAAASVRDAVTLSVAGHISRRWTATTHALVAPGVEKDPEDDLDHSTAEYDAWTMIDLTPDPLGPLERGHHAWGSLTGLTVDVTGQRNRVYDLTATARTEEAIAHWQQGPSDVLDETTTVPLGSLCGPAYRKLLRPGDSVAALIERTKAADDLVEKNDLLIAKNASLTDEIERLTMHLDFLDKKRQLAKAWSWWCICPKQHQDIAGVPFYCFHRALCAP